MPVLRFMHEGFQPGGFQVNQERPAAFVFASEEDAQKFPYVEEAPRIILAPAHIGSAKSAGAYADMAKALADAKAKGKAAQPSSAAVKVGCTLSHCRPSVCMGGAIPSWLYRQLCMMHGGEMLRCAKTLECPNGQFGGVVPLGMPVRCRAGNQKEAVGSA